MEVILGLQFSVHFTKTFSILISFYLQDKDDAHEKFLKITRAYEVLKDEDLRKKYDLHGEEGLDEKRNNKYESWNYYRDSFGIYDDDPEIITLSRSDFSKLMLGTYFRRQFLTFLFVTFRKYAKQCHFWNKKHSRGWK